VEIPGTRSWGNWQFRSASLCGPSRDATASTCRVSNTAPHHSAAQAHLCDPFSPPSQSRPTESLLFYSFLHKGHAAIVPHHLTLPHLGQAIRISTRKGSMLADQIETHTRCRYGTYHDSNYIRCVGRYVSFVEAWDYKLVFNSYNHHHQRQRRALPCRYASEIQKFQCAPGSRI
jgi:hypothetical protein